VKIKDHVKKFLFGLTIAQQYVCLSRENFFYPLKATVTLPNDSIPISLAHIFVGYKPVVLAFNDENDALKPMICVQFHNTDMQINSSWMNFPADDGAIARISLSLGPTSFKQNKNIKIYLAEFGEHFFLARFHQITNNFRDRFVQSNPDNVNLPGNLHDLVRIAYSVPRTIALMSLESGGVMNLFPTDLHGKVDDNYYMSSLRIGGKAQQQLERVRRVVLSEVESDTFREVYALGKNHMKEMSSTSNFNLSSFNSEKFSFKIPANALRYLELEVLEWIDAGIHRIYLYKIVNSVELGAGKTLAHIHQYYAQWRNNHKLETKYLLR
jgi:flavin reductase (DIM6/NTAB) family NADH-FMN oxidoreductase RutF